MQRPRNASVPKLSGRVNHRKGVLGPARTGTVQQHSFRIFPYGTYAICLKLAKLFRLLWRSLGDSNPCFRRERAKSRPGASKHLSRPAPVIGLDFVTERSIPVCIAGAAKGGPLPNPAGDLPMAGSCWWQRMLSQAQGAEYGKTYRYAAHRALEGGGAKRRNSEHSRRLKQSCRSESWRKPRLSQADARGAVEIRYASMARR